MEFPHPIIFFLEHARELHIIILRRKKIRSKVDQIQGAYRGSPKGGGEKKRVGENSLGHS
jgi:hypothetical protein